MTKAGTHGTKVKRLARELQKREEIPYTEALRRVLAAGPKESPVVNLSPTKAQR
jgi:hypothetical protein